MKNDSLTHQLPDPGRQRGIEGKTRSWTPGHVDPATSPPCACVSSFIQPQGGQSVS